MSIINQNKVNIKALCLFLEEYKEKILDEFNPIIKERNIKIDKYNITQDNQKIFLYKYGFSKEKSEDLQDIHPDKEVLVNSETQEIDAQNFNLLNANLFSIDKIKNIINISKFSEKEIAQYSKWYSLKTSPYFLLLNIERIINKLSEPHKFSTIDKYLLGIEEILNTNNSKIDPQSYEKFITRLNNAQKEAFEQMINAPNIALIKGPPGTGKTTVIEHFLEYSLSTEPERRIIFATNLHSSMDSIVEKINLNAFLKTKKILRLTKKPHSRRTNKDKILNVSKLADVYITTLASQRINVILMEKKYWFNDLKPILIIDEASASNILNVLSHTANIEKIIVIGDDQQLSPIYDWQYFNHFKDKGYTKEFSFLFIISFFNFIYNKNKDKCIFLNTNYRSESQIVKFINNFYNGELLHNKEQNDVSFEIVRSSNYLKSKEAFRYLMNNKNLTIRNTIFMCEYKKVIKDLNEFLEKKIFNTTTSIQGNEADNVCIFLAKNISTNDYRSQLDYRTINVAISRARKKVYIFSYDKIVNMHLIDKSNFWNKIRKNGSYVSIASLISEI